MPNVESEKLLKRKWPSLSALKSFFEKEGVPVLDFNGFRLLTKKYEYTLVSPDLRMEKRK